MKRIVVVLGVLLVAGYFYGRNAERPKGDLMECVSTPCPNSPNCVSSYADPGSDPQHAVEPLPLPRGQQPMDALRKVLEEMPRTTIVKEGDGCFHVEFRTFLGFVDDVHLKVDREAERVHVRSASRIGHYDFGKNRQRVEELRSRLQENNYTDPT